MLTHGTLYQGLMRALLGCLAALAAVGAPLDESEWGRRASDVRDAIREAFGAYAAGAGGFDVLVPESASGEDVMGSQVTLIEALDTLFVAGLREVVQGALPWESFVRDLANVDAAGRVRYQTFLARYRVVG